MNLSTDNPKKDTKYDLIKILFVLFIPYIALSIGQNGFLGLLPFVREEFVLSRVQIGYYSTSFFIGAALISVFTGIIVDKIGPKKGMLLGIGLLGAFLLIHGLSPTYNFLLLMGFLAGFGFSLITPSVTKAVILTTTREKRAISMGFTQTGFGIGGMVGASFLPFLGNILGWRITVLLTAVFILLIGPLIFKLYQEKNYIKNIVDIPENQGEKRSSFRYHILSLIKNKSLFRLCVLGIIFGISEGSTLSHFVVFLSEDLNMTKVMAGVGFATLHLGGMIGLIICGSFSDRFYQTDRRKSLFIIEFSTGIVFLFIGLLLTHPSMSLTLVFILSFILGFFVLGWPGVYLTSVGEFAGSNKAGLATGFALLMIRIGMLLSPTIFGYIADIQSHYQYSWLFFGLLITISSLFFLKD
ncbi:MAG: MFS transporter [Atribacterota bacterium]|nr:MFS transporter [Atribacterota bacterium]